MARRRFNYQFAAIVLTDALFHGDAKTAELHGISLRTITRYRKRMQTDVKLADAVYKLKQSVFDPKKRTMQHAIDAALAFIEDAPKHLSPDNPDHVALVVESFRVVSEIQLAHKMLDYRFKEPAPEQTIDAIAEDVTPELLFDS